MVHPGAALIALLLAEASVKLASGRPPSGSGARTARVIPLALLSLMVRWVAGSLLPDPWLKQLPNSSRRTVVPRQRSRPGPPS